MSRFEVDSAQVAQAGAAVQASAGRIGAEVDGLLRQLVELQGCWKGSAATSFQQALEDWRATQGRVHESLEGIRQALTSASRQYADAEDAAVRMFGH
jgi:WXG100 family type VII secretion target